MTGRWRRLCRRSIGAAAADRYAAHRYDRNRDRWAARCWPLLVLNALALALSALFLAQVGAAVRNPTGARWLPRGGLGAALRVGLAMLGAVGMIVGVMLALGLPFLFFAYLLIFLNPTIGLLALELLFVVGVLDQHLYRLLPRGDRDQRSRAAAGDLHQLQCGSAQLLGHAGLSGALAGDQRWAAG